MLVCTLFYDNIKVVTNESIGSKPIPSLERLNVRIVHLAELPREFRNLPFPILAPLKIALQILAIFYGLLIAVPRAPEYILVQVRLILNALSAVLVFSSTK